MSKNIFDPYQQVDDLPAKVVIGLERMAEVFKAMLWSEAKQHGLSPIQIQIVLFVAHHNSSLCTVSYLAKEFNVSKPTISDAIRVLHTKSLVKKMASPTDSRSYHLVLTNEGKKLSAQMQSFSDPLHQIVNQMDRRAQIDFFSQLSKLIFQLHKAKVLAVQRTCYACRFYKKSGDHSYCRLLKSRLSHTSIRLDCPEFEAQEYE